MSRVNDPVDGGPPDGDYAAYIEALVNGGASAPGAVRGAARGAFGARPRGRIGPIGPIGTSGPDNVPSPADAAWPIPVPASDSAAARAEAARRRVPPGTTTPARGTPPSGLPQREGDLTLAAQADRRRNSAGMFIVAIVLAIMGLRMLYGATQEPVFDAEDLIPGGFLLFFAIVMLRGARAARSRSQGPGAKLPPLSTIAPQRRQPGERR